MREALNDLSAIKMTLLILYFIVISCLFFWPEKKIGASNEDINNSRKGKDKT